MVPQARGVLCPFLLGSMDPYFVWRSYVETARRLARRESLLPEPELIDLAALTFGDDARSRAALAVEPVDPTRHLDAMLDDIRKMGLDGAYLYSRYEDVPLEACRRFRATMPADRVLFVSGRVSTASRADALFDAGADFVVFCGALERPDWRETLSELVAGSVVGRRRIEMAAQAGAR